MYMIEEPSFAVLTRQRVAAVRRVRIPDSRQPARPKSACAQPPWNDRKRKDIRKDGWHWCAYWTRVLTPDRWFGSDGRRL